MAKLIYTGNGFLADVPARDLTEEEVELFGGQAKLIKSGAYRPENAPEPQKAPPKKITKSEEA